MGRTSDDRLTGAAALIFVVLLIVQNAVTAATSPPNDADPARLLRFLHNGSWTIHLLVLTYLLGLPALFLFASGLSRRAAEAEPGAEIWAGLGRHAVSVIAVLFGLLNVLQVTMLAARDALARQPDLLTTLWTLHNAIFTLNLLAVGAALLGLSRAAAVAGLIPRVLARAAILGAALLALAAAPAVAEVHGSKLLAAGLLGFLVWIAFLATIGVRLLNTTPDSARLQGAFNQQPVS